MIKWSCKCSLLHKRIKWVFWIDQSLRCSLKFIFFGNVKKRLWFPGNRKKGILPRERNSVSLPPIWNKSVSLEEEIWCPHESNLGRLEIGHFTPFFDRPQWNKDKTYWGHLTGGYSTFSSLCSFHPLLILQPVGDIASVCIKECLQTNPCNWTKKHPKCVKHRNSDDSHDQASINNHVQGKTNYFKNDSSTHTHNVYTHTIIYIYIVCFNLNV